MKHMSSTWYSGTAWPVQTVFWWVARGGWPEYIEGKCSPAWSKPQIFIVTPGQQMACTWYSWAAWPVTTALFGSFLVGGQSTQASGHQTAGQDMSLDSSVTLPWRLDLV